MNALQLSASDLANPEVLTQPGYEPGKPIEELAEEFGLEPSSILKLASNENPLGSSPLALAAAKKALLQGQIYPDGSCTQLRRRLAKRFELEPAQFVIGNGSNELLELIAHVFLQPGDEAVMGKTSFAVYPLATRLMGASPIEVPMRGCKLDLEAMAWAVGPRTKLLFVACPNNPTGTANGAEEVLAFARSLPESCVLVFDEAYAEYNTEAPDLRPLIAEGRKVICLRTFSKLHGLAALRIGYAYTTPEIATLLQRVRQPFNVNGIAQAAALAALDDVEFVARSLRENRKGLIQLEAGLRGLGIKTLPSKANFLMLRLGPRCAEIHQALLRQGIILRPLASYGLPEWLRITVGSAEQNARVLSALETLTATVPGAP